MIARSEEPYHLSVYLLTNPIRETQQNKPKRTSDSKQSHQATIYIRSIDRSAMEGRGLHGPKCRRPEVLIDYSMN